MDNRLMVSILKLRRNIYEIYQKHSRMTGIFLKGISAFILLFAINGFYGHSESNMMLIAVALSIVCAALPMRMTYLASAVFTMLHLWQVSWDVTIFYAAAVVLSYLLVCRIKPDTAIIIAFAPLFFFCKIPFLLPLLVGSISSLFGVAAMVFGVLFFYFGVYSLDVMVLLSSATGGDSVIAIKSILDSFGADTRMLLLVLALVVAALVVYVLYHQAFDHAWYIGIAAGGLAGLVVYLAGGIIFDIENGNMVYLFTIPFAIIVAFATQFFRCIIDYSGVEKLEFEDDEYYYYIKAIPKVNVIVDDFTMLESLKEKMAQKEEMAKTAEQSGE